MKTVTEKTEIICEYDIESISPPGEMLLFDIETTGLKKEMSRIYLIGAGYFDEDGTFTVRQWLAERADEERDIIEAFARFAEGYKTLVHFNGAGFDIPYTAYRARHLGIDLDFSLFESFDIYRKLRPLKKFLGMERMNQKALENFLKIERRDCMGGGELIPYFYEYAKSGDEECERLLLLHNNDDVRGMILLTQALAYADIFEKNYRPGDVCAQIIGDTFVMEFTLFNPAPVPILYEREELVIAVCGDLLQINLKIRNETAKIPVKNVNDYYYLPAEDIIVHKDVARFVDRRFRRKATKRNCFLKREGRYIPSFGIGGEYLLPDKKGRLSAFLDAEEALRAPESFHLAHAAKILTKTTV